MSRPELKTYFILGKSWISNRESSNRARPFTARGKGCSGKSKTGTYKESTKKIRYWLRFNRMDALMTEWSRGRS
jgi:hypothetical protein